MLTKFNLTYQLIKNSNRGVTIKNKSRLFNKVSLFNFSKENKDKKSEQNFEDKFFYENSNLENVKNSNSLISLKNDSKMKSKLTLEEPTELPLVENEAYRELYKNFSLYTNQEISNELDDIAHNEERNGKKYKYGLCEKNELPFTALVPIEETPELPKTSTENLFELLELDGESSYESLIAKIQNELSHAGETQHKVLEYGIPIPLDVIKDNKTMIKLRKYSMYNVDLPGNVEDIHPNKFIANLKPVEEFRHTPVVAIPEKDINDYRKKIEDKNRMGVYFEVKKQTLYYYGIAFLFVIILYQTIKHFYRESENMQTEIEKIRFRRLRYREEEDIN